MRNGGRFGESSQSLQRQILLNINNSKVEEAKRERKGGQDGTAKKGRTGGGKGRRREQFEEVCVQAVVDVGGRLHFSVHLLNVAEIHRVAAMFCSLKALPDV